MKPAIVKGGASAAAGGAGTGKAGEAPVEEDVGGVPNETLFVGNLSYRWVFEWWPSFVVFSGYVLLLYH